MRVLTTVKRKFYLKLISLNISEVFVSLLLVANIFLLFTSIIAESYYNLVTVGSGFDGWCDKNIYGIGVHCFSDYTLTELIVNESNPWQTELISPQNYPAAALVIAYFFSRIGMLAGNPQVGLILYLLSMAFCLMLPGIWATKGKKTYLKILIIAITGLTTVPAIMALDRGNSIGFVAPALLLLVIGTERKKTSLIVLAIALASFVKPQFALLILVPLCLNMWRAFAYSLVGVTLVQILPFLLWPLQFPQTIKQALDNAFAYGGKPDFSTFFPMNSSISSSLFELSALGNASLYKTDLPKYIQQNPTMIAVFVFAIFLIWSFLLKKTMPEVFIGIYSVAFVSTFATVSWSYYLVFAIPVAALFIRDPLISFTEMDDKLSGIGERKTDSPGIYKFSMLFIVIALTLTLSKVIVPNVTPNSDPYPYNTVELSTSFWVLGAFLTLLLYSFAAARNKYRKK